ncbi:MAG: phosphatase PAP2 family protein [Chitinophagaceae bacterium]
MLFLQTNAHWFTGIVGFDRKLFFFVNNTLANNFFDTVMPFLREANIWIPLYLFMLVFAAVNFGKRGWLWILFVICTVGLCDLVSSHLIKEFIFRVRPCQNPGLARQIRILVNYCPHSSSFTSSHATNHFGLAMFFVITLRTYTSAWINLFFAWAAVICFAQVYVGVHYPIDVLSGAVLGGLLGYITGVFFNNYAGLISLQDKRA